MIEFKHIDAGCSSRGPAEVTIRCEDTDMTYGEVIALFRQFSLAMGYSHVTVEEYLDEE